MSIDWESLSQLRTPRKSLMFSICYTAPAAVAKLTGVKVKSSMATARFSKR